MNIILSKKGFDTNYGGYPSVIDKTALYSMPIPEHDDKNSGYCELKTVDGKSLFDTVKPYYKNIYVDGKRQEFTADIKCHADPNINNYFQRDNFLGSLGQVNQPQNHLENQGVTAGSIFIFYGWFKGEDGKDKHTAWGYLQIGEIIKTDKLTDEQRKAIECRYPWLKDQPHWINEIYTNNSTNTIYVAAERCSFDPNIKGYGVFTYSPDLDFTNPTAQTMREWSLPALKGLGISWNGDRKVAEDGSFTLSRTFCQECVIEESDKATKWAENLIKNHAKR